MERDESTTEHTHESEPRQPPNLWILVWMTIGALLVAVAVIGLTLL
jgi:hypothetical protein